MKKSKIEKMSKQSDLKRYWVIGEYSDGTEVEEDCYDYYDAQRLAGCMVENGGFAHISDDEGNEYSIF